MGNKQLYFNEDHENKLEQLQKLGVITNLSEFLCKKIDEEIELQDSPQQILRDITDLQNKLAQTQEMLTLKNKKLENALGKEKAREMVKKAEKKDAFTEEKEMAIIKTKIGSLLQYKFKLKLDLQKIYLEPIWKSYLAIPPEQTECLENFVKTKLEEVGAIKPEVIS